VATVTTELATWLHAQLDLEEAHAHKDLHLIQRATNRGQWEPRYGYNLPYSLFVVNGAEICRLIATDGPQYHPGGQPVDGHEDAQTARWPTWQPNGQ
jgi:hypothetical protein